ncbi:hypothetical protein D018_0609B, partial [Vibrio parahaemolyticus VP2007-007]
NSPVAS